MKKYFWLSVFSAGLLACTAAPLKSPEVKIQGVRVESLSIPKARLVFDLLAYNPNSSVLKVDSVKYDVELNDQPIAEGEINEPVELKAEASSLVSMPVNVELGKVFGNVLMALKEPEFHYRIKGAARSGLFSLPFDHKGKISLLE